MIFGEDDFEGDFYARHIFEIIEFPTLFVHIVRYPDKLPRIWEEDVFSLFLKSLLQKLEIY